MDDARHRHDQYALLSDVERKRTFNVRDYGAAGDGVMDDSAAIQSAINAAKVNGGVVYLPAGSYNIGTTLDLTDINPTAYAYTSEAGVIFAGDGTHATYLTGGEAAYGFIDIVSSNRLRLEDFSIVAGVTCQYGIIGGRTTGDGSSGEHIIRNVLVYGAFTVAAVFMLASEACTYDHLTVYTTQGAGLVLAGDIAEWTVTAKYAPLTDTAPLPSGNGLAALRSVLALTIGLDATDYPLVLEYVQTLVADNLYTISSGAPLIMMQKNAHSASFRCLHQEWNSDLPGATEPYGIFLRNFQQDGIAQNYRISIESSSLYSIYGDDDSVTGAWLGDFSFRSSWWRGTKTYQIDVWACYGAEIRADSSVASISEVTTPLYRYRAAGGNNHVFPNSYTTAGRPAPWDFGVAMIYDTTLNVPLWASPAGWRDATGALV